MTDFPTLRPKTHSYSRDDSNGKKIKGARKSVIKPKLENYEHCS